MYLMKLHKLCTKRREKKWFKLSQIQGFSFKHLAALEFRTENYALRMGKSDFKCQFAKCCAAMLQQRLCVCACLKKHTNDITVVIFVGFSE